jgi:NAD(P)-dependent dehydrogenase (short-subunit alcohol dehydrogenase family)
VAETVSRIERAGGRALAVTADVTDADAVAQLVGETERQLGPVDLLVNNAGSVSPIAPLWEVDPAAWRACVNTNLCGTFLCAWAVLPGMVARRRGRIINLAGSVPTQAMPYFTAYDGAKAAVLRLTEGLALETREHGVHIFAVSPGMVHTTMADDVLGSPWARRVFPTLDASAQSWDVPPERAAAVCVYLASGQADALSGHYVNVRADVAELVRRAEEIAGQDLYTLRLRT